MNKSKILLWLSLCALITACSTTKYTPSNDTVSLETQPAPSAKPAPRPASMTSKQNQVRSDERLGTKWGDDLNSYVTQVDLKRLSNRPMDETQVRYANKQFSGRSINSISLAAGKVSFSIVDDRGRILPLYRDGQNYYLSAIDGQSYQLRYSNTSNQTFEIVASVDGLDVLDGSRASRSNSGYVLRPYSSFAIEGFRKSNSSVASFTFSRPKDAYAANSANGSVQNTGVIGTVVYELKAPQYQPAKNSNKGYAPAPNAFPAD
ncbi:hypothetical protein [Acinetobacter nematophilus]|uniref:Lipoprotein n=1 Tax=Acinetobacter nematophilus TaxID=2994642 RepID=A0A9X3DSK3_9GAMM|nr:hypothetical protein [Acinetobacter nematophilus]MCX5466637.1 hypothetical protein [Acinetobacter nematophilus]